MDACISAARALWESFFAGEVFESGHQRPLNGQSVGLDLPTSEVVAIVSEREFEISQVGNLDVLSGRKTSNRVLLAFRPTLFNA